MFPILIISQSVMFISSNFNIINISNLVTANWLIQLKSDRSYQEVRKDKHLTIILYLIITLYSAVLVEVPQIVFFFDFRHFKHFINISTWTFLVNLYMSMKFHLFIKYFITIIIIKFSRQDCLVAFLMLQFPFTCKPFCT